MPFTRPTLGELRKRIAADLTNKLPGADTRLRVNNLRAFSEVEAGTSHLLYGRLDWSFKQLFPDTAEAEFLDRWASIWGVQRIPANPATGPATWIVSDPNARLLAGAIVERGDGVRYVVSSSVLAEGGVITAPLLASTPGASGNALPLTKLTLLTTFAGVAVEGVVDEPGLAGGADEQSDELLLQAVLARIQMPPHGGAAFDYVRWALEVPGVTRAWCYPVEMGAGTVTVRFMMDDVRAPTGIPLPADVEIVADYIDLRRPVTAEVYVVAPVPLPVDVTITALEPDTPEIRDGIFANLTQMLLNEAEPGQPIYLSQWSTAIGITAGVERFVLTAPTTQSDAPPGEIILLGTVSYL
jgi:uncharacterized phage protein gp47/JayE